MGHHARQRGEPIERAEPWAPAPLGKEVVLTDELVPDYVMLRYRPDLDEVVGCLRVTTSAKWSAVPGTACGAAWMLWALGWKGQK